MKESISLRGSVSQKPNSWNAWNTWFSEKITTIIHNVQYHAESFMQWLTFSPEESLYMKAQREQAFIQYKENSAALRKDLHQVIQPLKTGAFVAPQALQKILATYLKLAQQESLSPLYFHHYLLGSVYNSHW